MDQIKVISSNGFIKRVKEYHKIQIKYDEFFGANLRGKNKIFKR